MTKAIYGEPLSAYDSFVCVVMALALLVPWLVGVWNIFGFLWRLLNG